MDVKSQKLEQMKKKWVETNPKMDLYYRYKELLIAFFFSKTHTYHDCKHIICTIHYQLKCQHMTKSKSKI